MGRKPRLLDQVRERLRVKHYSYRTEQQYVTWIRRFILFHGKRHPTTMGGPEVERFLTHLPTVLTPEQVRAVLAQLDGVYWLIAALLYGSGLRLMGVSTTQIYTQVLNKGAGAVCSPADF